MITFFFLILVAGAALGGIYLAMRSGTKGTPNDMAGKAVQEEQVQNNNPRGDVRSMGSGND